MATKKQSAQAVIKHLAANLSEAHLSKKQAEAVLGDLVGLVTKHLKKGDRVRISGLDILKVRKRAARMGRDPATGEVKASKKVAARPKVVGTTRDGVKILRPKAGPDHFTSREIRKAVSEVAKRTAG